MAQLAALRFESFYLTCDKNSCCHAIYLWRGEDTRVMAMHTSQNVLFDLKEVLKKVLKGCQFDQKWGDLIS